MNVLGIDYDSHGIHVAILYGNEEPDWVKFHHLLLHGKNSLQSTRDVYRVNWSNLCLGYDVYAVGIERPFGSPAVVSALMRLQGAIIGKIPPRIHLYEVSPVEWKQRIGLTMMCPKSASIGAIMKLLQTEPPTHDFADAAAIGLVTFDKARTFRNSMSSPRSRAQRGS